MATEIHPTAIVDPTSELGVDVIIGPYTIIEASTQLGDGTRVDAFAQVKKFTSLGRNNHIYSYACIGEAPQDIKYQGQETWLRLGDNNKVREYATLNRGTPDGRGVTRIGSNCFLMAYTHVAHDCILEDNVIMANSATLAGHVHLGQRSVVGGLCAVHQFVRIGEYAFIGGKSGVAQDVPPYMLVAGERAKIYGPNLIGMRRAGFDRHETSAVKKTFHLIWGSGLSRDQAIEQVLQDFGQFRTVQKLVDFLKSSSRGIVSRDKSRKDDGD
ncbi:acyl-ACP--UDP-N-acetylglucosamine O-acyltransferase [Desulfonatronovibrio hydrogenovorans]|uniref:acyl-ACP--UDP-N-acetylglucosamine O-acyltransferase n=1 Tax=Desulfonatronovibrio hydrogenovorans TaxID=53245 RepID=UPI0004909900|nr:acyl-ACP--UDP-N-acetylglucosamine O-acyltransferase [Desulfonatronovibrio hydrogenovorans]